MDSQDGGMLCSLQHGGFQQHSEKNAPHVQPLVPRLACGQRSRLTEHLESGKGFLQSVDLLMHASCQPTTASKWLAEPGHACRL